MYRFNAEDPGQSPYTPTTVGVILYNYICTATQHMATHTLIILTHHMGITRSTLTQDQVLQEIRVAFRTFRACEFTNIQLFVRI